MADLTYKEVAEILRIMDSSNCAELILEVGGNRIVVRKDAAAGEPPSATGATAASPMPSPPAATVPSSPPAEAPSPRDTAEGEPPAASVPPQQTATPSPALQASARNSAPQKIRAPMVGTFYRRPSPQEPPFVEVGDRVAAGDAVGLIEVMKLYTTIEAPCAGRIAEIAVENAQLLEHDQIIMIIEPD